MNCRDYQRAIAEGREPKEESFWIIYRSRMGLREDEGQNLCTIALEADDKTQELVRQFYVDHGGKENFFLHTPPGPARSAEGDALERRKDMVMVEAIAKLKQQLTDVSYKRLERYFYDQHCNGSHHLNGHCTDAERDRIYPRTHSSATVAGSD